jgi:hypothetical protein
LRNRTKDLNNEIAEKSVDFGSVKILSAHYYSDDITECILYHYSCRLSGIYHWKSRSNPRL